MGSNSESGSRLMNTKRNEETDHLLKNEIRLPDGKTMIEEGLNSARALALVILCVIVFLIIVGLAEWLK